MPGISTPLYDTDAENHANALDEYYQDCFCEPSIAPKILETTVDTAEFTVTCTFTGTQKHFTVSL